MNKILIVDDEKNIVNALKEYFEYHNFKVDVAYDGMKALDMATEFDYDCILLDIMMPTLNGYETVKALKEIKNTPVLMISAKGEQENKLKGFSLGVDDYIVKPFDLSEVLARVKAVLKRTTGYFEYKKVNGLSVDVTAHKVFINDTEVKLAKLEFDLLMLFLKNKNILLTRDKIFTIIWGWDYDSLSGRTIDTHIANLRKHLMQYGNSIKTIRGVGYKFEV